MFVQIREKNIENILKVTKKNGIQKSIQLFKKQLKKIQQEFRTHRVIFNPKQFSYKNRQKPYKKSKKFHTSVHNKFKFFTFFSVNRSFFEIFNSIE